MEWEDFTSPLGDPPSSLDYSYAPCGNTAPLSRREIYIPRGLWISRSVSPTADASLTKVSGQLEKLSIDNFVHAPPEDSFGHIKQPRKDIALFRCGCWRLDRSRWRHSLENDPTIFARAGKPVAYSTYDKDCGLCELSNARARHEAEKSEEIDEIIETSKSDKYGDHVHLTMCERTRDQPPKQTSSLADLIVQNEIRQTVDLDEYMRASNGKALDFGVDAFRGKEISDVQQSPIISLLHDVMLPNYFADLDRLNETTQSQIASAREARERTLEDPDFMMSAGPEEVSHVPKRQNITGNAVSRSDICKRTEEEWECTSSREKRYVMLVPLLDACKACKKDKKDKKGKKGKKRKGRNATSLRAKDATNDPPEAEGALDIVEQMPDNGAYLQATKAPEALEPDDAIFLEFTEQTRENTPCMLISEVSKAPESDTQVLGETAEDTLGVPDTRDTQILRHDAAVFEQMSEDNLDALGIKDSESPQHDEVFFEQMKKNTTGIDVAERLDTLDVQVLDDDLREPETLGTHTLQHNGAFERIGESMPWLQATEGTNAMDPDTNFPERSTDNSPCTPATQGKDAKQQYSDFLDRISEIPPRIQAPEEIDGREPYVDILRRCPFSGKLDLRPMNMIFATPEPMAQANRQAKPSLASFKDRIHLLNLPPGIYPRQPSTETKVTAGRPNQDQPQEPSSQEFISWSSAKPRRLFKPSEIEDGDDLRLVHSPTQTRTEGESMSGIPPSQKYRSWILPEAHRQQPSSELRMEDNPTLGGCSIENFWPPDLARARGHLHISDIARADDAWSNGGRSNNLGPEGITGAPQPQVTSIWQVYPHLRPGGSSPNITPFHPAETHQQQRSTEAQGESNWQWERPPQDFRPLYPTEVSQQQPSLEAGGEDNLHWETRLSQNSRIPQSAATLRQELSTSTRREGEPNLRLPPRMDFGPPQPTGGDQRNLPSKPTTYDRDPPLGHPVQAFPRPKPRKYARQKENTVNVGARVQPQSRSKALPLGPPVQAFPPPRPWKDPHQKGNTVDVGARVQPHTQPEAPPSQSSPWLNSMKGFRQGECSGVLGQQIQTPLTGRPFGSMPAPMRQQDQHQAIWRPDTGGRLVSPSTGPSVPSLSPPKHQREAGARGVLRPTGKQGKAPPPVSRPESTRKNKRNHEG